jgi:large subunit ribosomal protein L29
MKNTSELRSMSIVELQSKLLELRKEQFNLRMKRASGTLDKTHTITIARKSIARLKTLITEKAGICNDK